jgi:phospholipid/cholesterol/gamma-HCH transport system ATP-binding protein
MASVRRIADKVAMVHNGVIIWNGPASQMDNTGIAEVDQFVQGYADGPLTLAAQAAARGG